jgi:hypothetical protein
MAEFSGYPTQVPVTSDTATDMAGDSLGTTADPGPSLEALRTTISPLQARGLLDGGSLVTG